MPLLPIVWSYRSRQSHINNKQTIMLNQFAGYTKSMLFSFALCCWWWWCVCVCVGGGGGGGGGAKNAKEPLLLGIDLNLSHSPAFESPAPLTIPQPTPRIHTTVWACILAKLPTTLMVDKRAKPFTIYVILPTQASLNIQNLPK